MERLIAVKSLLAKDQKFASRKQMPKHLLSISQAAFRINISPDVADPLRASRKVDP